MKLISLHIDAFGKLRNFRIDFENGITEILGENGYGKTTLAAFIKAMLYGIPDNRDKEKIRKHYAPWSGGDFGGTLDIETEKGRYRIVRRFTLKLGDTFELLSLESGLESKDYSENIGFELFGIDAESYEKSVYLPQREVDIKMTDPIGARLTGLLEDSSDMLDFTSAIERIKDRRREFEHYRGNRGLIENTRDELAECERQIAEAEAKLRDAEQKKTEAGALEAEIAQIEKDIAALSEKLREENEKKLILKDHEIYRELCRDREECREKLERTEREFKNGVPNKREIADAENLSREIASARKKRAEAVSEDKDTWEYESLKAVFENGTPSAYELASKGMAARDIVEKREELSRLYTALPQKIEVSAQKSQKGIIAVAGVGAVGLVLLIVGIALSAVLAVVGAIVLVAGLAIAAAAVVSQKKLAEQIGKAETANNEREIKLKELEEKQRSLEKLESSFEEFLLTYKKSAEGSDPERIMEGLAKEVERYEKIAAEAKVLKERIESFDSEINEKEAKLVAFLEKYAFVGDNEKSPEEIRELTERLERLKEDLDGYSAKAERFKKEKNIEEEIEYSSIDTDILESAISAARDKLREQSEQKSRLAEAAKRLDSDAEPLPFLKDKRLELSARIIEYSERKEIYDKTEKLLNQAKENLSSRYLLKMKNSFAEHFAALTDNDREITLDAKLEIKLREDSGAKKAAEYSAGWQAVIALCMRLSLIDSLYETERPFLVLDDPFVNLDQEKLVRALRTLRELSKNTQIVYLTCHDSRSIKKAENY